LHGSIKARCSKGKNRQYVRARASSSNQPTKGTLVGKVCWDIDVVFEDLLQTNGGLELISVA
jgi:hypothetical protein